MFACAFKQICLNPTAGSGTGENAGHIISMVWSYSSVLEDAHGALQVTDPQAVNQVADVLLEQTKELYCSQSVSTTARAWNELREKVLVDALDNLFKPQFERELRAKLTSDAREGACLKCSKHIWKLAVEGPVAVRSSSHRFVQQLKVMHTCALFCTSHCTCAMSTQRVKHLCLDEHCVASLRFQFSAVVVSDVSVYICPPQNSL